MTLLEMFPLHLLVPSGTSSGTFLYCLVQVTSVAPHPGSCAELLGWPASHHHLQCSFCRSLAALRALLAPAMFTHPCPAKVVPASCTSHSAILAAAASFLLLLQQRGQLVGTPCAGLQQQPGVDSWSEQPCSGHPGHVVPLPFPASTPVFTRGSLMGGREMLPSSPLLHRPSEHSPKQHL